jgi:predicted transcriptional regulator
MKRDDDYLRQLLMRIEDYERPSYPFDLLLEATIEEKKELHHLQILCDAGYLSVNEKKHYRITNQGHDFLAVIRDDTIWQKIKTIVAPVGGATLGIIKNVGEALLKSGISSQTGLSFRETEI